MISRKLCTAVLAAAVIVLAAGCSAIYVGNPRAMGIDDIIKMARYDVGTDIVIRQIEVTRSRFELSTDDIVALTEAGVDDEVIEAMIDSGESYADPYRETRYPDYGGWVNGYGMYPSPWSSYIGYRFPPYRVYREPGLVGRFYQYYTPGRSRGEIRRYGTPERRSHEDDDGDDER